MSSQITSDSLLTEAEVKKPTIIWNCKSSIFFDGQQKKSNHVSGKTHLNLKKSEGLIHGVIHVYLLEGFYLLSRKNLDAFVMERYIALSFFPPVCPIFHLAHKSAYLCPKLATFRPKNPAFWHQFCIYICK